VEDICYERRRENTPSSMQRDEMRKAPQPLPPSGRLGLTWWTTGPARVEGGARRYGFFGTSTHFVRTSESFKT
jgi:hypothetical protein